MHYKSARIAVTLDSDAGSLGINIKTGSIPQDAVGQKIGEHIDRELKRLFPEGDSKKAVSDMAAEIARLNGEVVSLRAQLEDKPKARRARKKV